MAPCCGSRLLASALISGCGERDAHGTHRDAGDLLLCLPGLRVILRIPSAVPAVHGAALSAHVWVYYNGSALFYLTVYAAVSLLGLLIGFMIRTGLKREPEDNESET